MASEPCPTSAFTNEANASGESTTTSATSEHGFSLTSDAANVASATPGQWAAVRLIVAPEFNPTRRR
jgi:hypothetical protein